MIKKFLSLRRVGIFYNGCENSAVSFEKVTLIYADNGRGKSTFASVMRAIGDQDDSHLIRRKTMDQTDSPTLEILLDNNSRPKYELANWSGGNTPDTLVFDNEFVDNHVYSGASVDPAQKQALLDFALGSSTVELKKRIDDLTELIKGGNEQD